MRLVKPTNPPSMAVVVDTLTDGKIVLAISPADAVKGRIDLVAISNSWVGILCGTPNRMPTPPFLAKGVRAIAKIRIPKATTVIVERNIEELP